jgi:hypothetical protein
MKPITLQQGAWIHFATNGFLFLLKSITLALLVLAGVLIISQSSVAPVSTRLLSAYAMEYAMHKVKPYRHYFPKPYMINLEEQTR